MASVILFFRAQENFQWWIRQLDQTAVLVTASQRCRPFSKNSRPCGNWCRFRQVRRSGLGWRPRVLNAYVTSLVRMFMVLWLLSASLLAILFLFVCLFSFFKKNFYWSIVDDTLLQLAIFSTFSTTHLPISNSNKCFMAGACAPDTSPRLPTLHKCQLIKLWNNYTRKWAERSGSFS